MVLLSMPVVVTGCHGRHGRCWRDLIGVAIQQQQHHQTDQHRRCNDPECGGKPDRTGECRQNQQSRGNSDGP
jgi:hypothetical protein